EIAGLRAAGLAVRPADNDIRPGIAAVSARVQTGRWRGARTGCPQLLREALLYRYPTGAPRPPPGANPRCETKPPPAPPPSRARRRRRGWRAGRAVRGAAPAPPGAAGAPTGRGQPAAVAATVVTPPRDGPDTATSTL